MLEEMLLQELQLLYLAMGAGKKAAAAIDEYLSNK